MAYAISDKRYYSSIQTPFENIKEFISTLNQLTDFTITKNYLSRLSVPEDYPTVTEAAKDYANSMCRQFALEHSIEPLRVEASVEGGIAIVYAKKDGFLKRNYKEVFIEIYNNSEIAVSYSENYKVKKIEEVSFDSEKIYTDFISKLL